MKKITSLKDYLKESLGEAIALKVNRSFEVVGDIAIIELNVELDEYAKEIGEALLKTNKNIKTVLKKSGIHQGEFRTQDLIYVIGEEKYETIYLENGIRLKINPGTVYFSARLSTEREQLMNKLQPYKRVLVMFSGSGPYSYVALKKQPDLARITSIEINPNGHQYALESMKLNKNLIKKSILYKNLIQFLKDNDIPVYEKILLKILNNLKFNFINSDVRKALPLLDLKLYAKDFTNTHNQLFSMKAKNIVDFLSKSEIKDIILDLDEMNLGEQIKNLFILFSEKFNWICKIDNKIYLFDNQILKSLLLNIFEGLEVDCINKFDEIYMPLPKDAELFLDCAFKTGDKNSVVHMYDFVHENEFPNKSEDAVRNAAEKYDKKIEIIGTRKVGQYSPRKFRVCCDFKILN